MSSDESLASASRRFYKQFAVLSDGGPPAGEKPNQFRIYNKVEERLNQYGWMVREAKKRGLAIKTFEETFGYSEHATITRVERQYGGSRCGGNLRSLLKLDRTNPFEPLIFLKSSGREINPFGDEQFLRWRSQVRREHIWRYAGSIHSSSAF